jgi:hypothetical protein
VRLAATALAVLAALGGCVSAKECREETALLQLSFTGGAEEADMLELSLSVDEHAPASVQPIAHNPGERSGTLQVAVPGYGTHHQLNVRVVPLKAQAAIGAPVEQSFPLQGSCIAVSLEVGAGSAGPPDAAAHDGPAKGDGAAVATMDARDATPGSPDASVDLTEPGETDGPGLDLPPMPDAPGVDAPVGPDAGCPSPPCKKAPGASCGATGECARGTCVDGVCCVESCATCQSCGGPGGTCMNIGRSGHDSVPAGTCVAPHACDGQGACKLENGQACGSTASLCLSGLCVDGVCCESACSGICQACNLGGAGTCTTVRNASDPGTCAGGSMCNGSGACMAPTPDASPPDLPPDTRPSFCDSLSAKFCDDFEGGGTPGAYAIGPGITVDATKAYSGGKAVHFKPAGTAYMSFTKQFPFNDLNGRMMMFMVSAPTTSSHWNWLTSDNAGNTQWSIGGQYGKYELVCDPPDIGIDSQTPFPAGRWVCVQWHFGFNPSDSKTAFGLSIDGVPVDGGTFTGPNGTAWKAGSWKNLNIGWEVFGAGVPPEFWIDDLAFGEQPIACP